MSKIAQKGPGVKGSCANALQCGDPCARSTGCSLGSVKGGQLFGVAILCLFQGFQGRPQPGKRANWPSWPGVSGDYLQVQPSVIGLTVMHASAQKPELPGTQIQTHSVTYKVVQADRELAQPCYIVPRYPQTSRSLAGSIDFPLEYRCGVLHRLPGRVPTCHPRLSPDDQILAYLLLLVRPPQLRYSHFDTDLGWVPQEAIRFTIADEISQHVKTDCFSLPTQPASLENVAHEFGKGLSNDTIEFLNH